LRLCVSSQDYREDLRISNEILTQLIEAYRKIRNTCRFLLSNLYDFKPAENAVPYEQLPELDRWALMRLDELIFRVTKAYENFEFHSIFHALNNFCSVDMSAVYLDITKDRLYTFHKDSKFRRSSQTAMHEIVVALTKLMAPVLSFTGEEIWRTMPDELKTEKVISVHLTCFPRSQPKWNDPKLEKSWEDLLVLRTVVQSRLEEKRRDKIIGSSLEAKVIIHASKSNPAMYDVLRPYQDFLHSLFIVSHVELRGVDHVPELLMSDLSDGFGVEVVKADSQKCQRCWNYREAVGMDKEHPTLCDRCLEAIR